MTAKRKSSQEIQKDYNDICFYIGRERRNEKRAQENLSKLEKQQKELEESFNAAAQAEQEFAKQEQEAAEKTKAFEAKVTETQSA